MSSAFALIIILVAFGIFMPDVLHALSVFLLTLLQQATAFLNNMPAYPADMSRTLVR